MLVDLKIIMLNHDIINDYFGPCLLTPQQRFIVHVFSLTIFESLHEKINNLDFPPGPTQTSLYSHRISDLRRRGIVLQCFCVAKTRC